MHICNDSGMKEEAVEYHKKLKRLEARVSQDEFGYVCGAAWGWGCPDAPDARGAAVHNTWHEAER